MRHIRMSKYAAERIPLTVNMLNRCGTGEWPISAATTATVSSGTDATPSAILDGPPTVVNLEEVSQYVIGGLPGVIYDVQVAATTNLGSIYIDKITLAIFPTVT